MKLPKFLYSHAPTPVVKLPWSGLTLAEWRSSPARIDYAQKLFADPRFQEMLAVLQNTLVVRESNGQPELELGRALGHQDALILLCSLRQQSPELPQTISADYGVPYPTEDLT